MKIAVLLLILPMALAAPTIESRDLPDMTPVTIKNLNPKFDVNCGKTTIKGQDIYNAASWATNLWDDQDHRLGSNEYPHYYGNSDNFNFEHSKECNNVPSGYERRLFPIAKDGYYDGTNDDVKQFRVVFVHDPIGKQDSQGHPISYYCGTIYHNNRNTNDFAGCDIVKK